MRLAILTLVVLCCVVGCRRPAEKAVVRHSNPVDGIRIVDITLAAQDPPLDLRWQYGWPYGGMVALRKCATLSPGSSARIVIVENLDETCGVYVYEGESTQKLALDIPKHEPNSPRSVVVTQRTPSRDELGGTPQEIVRIEWIDSNDPSDKDKTGVLVAFDLVGQGE